MTDFLSTMATRRMPASGVTRTVAVLLAALCAWLALASPSVSARVRGATSRVVTLPDGLRMRVLESPRAAGPSLVFVPGWMMTADIWAPQIAHFAPTHHVVAIDPRSQGRTSVRGEGLFPAARARDLNALIGRLKLAPVVLVGWSVGASDVAMYIDQFGTKDVAGLVFVDQSLGGDPNPDRTLAVVQWLGGEVAADRRRETAAFVRDLFKRPQPEAFLASLTRAAMTMPTSAAVAAFVGSIATRTAPALPKIDKPTLIVYASSAAENPSYTRMQSQIQGSRLERFESAGHALFVDEPDRFNALLDDFLRALPK